MTESDERDCWENAECPTDYSRECFPPAGLKRLLPHHFKLWRYPVYRSWWWWRWYSPAGCCCCCDEHGGGGRPSEPVSTCSINLELEPDTFGPGRSIHIVVAPGVYFAEFFLRWSASGSGQVTVVLELISGPVRTPQTLMTGRGPSDHFLFSTRTPGSYVFKATARDSQGNTCFDTVQVDLPAI